MVKTFENPGKIFSVFASGISQPGEICQGFHTINIVKKCWNMIEVNLMNQDSNNEKELLTSTKLVMNSKKLSSLFETVRFKISFWTFHHDSWDYHRAVQEKIL